MVDITPRIPATRQLINGYGAGGFTINHVHFEGSVLVMPERTIAWSVTSPEEISEIALADIINEPGVELLLIGSGVHMAILSPALRATLKQKHIAVEAMDTGAACRTYNILLAEERKVAAALLAV